MRGCALVLLAALCAVAAGLQEYKSASTSFAYIQTPNCMWCGRPGVSTWSQHYGVGYEGRKGRSC